MKREFFIDEKKITVFCSGTASVPVVYLNTVMNEGGAIWEACRKIGCPDFALAAISKLNWDHDMSPWTIPPISADDTPCTGGADEYLCLLTSKIMPAVNEILGRQPLYTAIAGYSLAGLFAVYSMYGTNTFSKIASASGSFWFPEFNEFAKSGKLKITPECMYFSLGNSESHTKNEVLKTVEENTKNLERFYKSCGIKTIYVENDGNHFQNTTTRMANGIKWILQN